MSTRTLKFIAREILVEQILDKIADHIQDPIKEGGEIRKILYDYLNELGDRIVIEELKIK